MNDSRPTVASGMDTQFDRERSRLTLAFASAADLERFIAPARQQSGFLVDLPLGLALHQHEVTG